jgi:hypothetical protein
MWGDKSAQIDQNLRNCTAKYVLCFFKSKNITHVNFANVLWVAFSVLSGLLSLVEYAVYYCRMGQGAKTTSP